MRTSQAGIDLIKRFEGLRLHAYICAAGVLTIGYGHTKSVRRGQQITEQQAEDLLREDLRHFEEAVERLVTVHLEQHEFDALVSFTFNVGEGALAKSTLLRKLNAGDKQDAAHEFGKWVKAGKVTLSGLVRRRKAEQALFEGHASQVRDRGGDGTLTVRQVQTALNAAHNARLKEDGVLGPLTVAKIREFQQRHRLIVDGIVGPQTEEALRRYL
jgi:lysozyme